MSRGLLDCHITGPVLCFIVKVVKLTFVDKGQIPKATVTLSRIEGRTAPDQISRMVRGGPADLGHFVHSSHTSPDGPATDFKPG